MKTIKGLMLALVAAVMSVAVTSCGGSSKTLDVEDVVGTWQCAEGDETWVIDGFRYMNPDGSWPDCTGTVTMTFAESCITESVPYKIDGDKILISTTTDDGNGCPTPVTLVATVDGDKLFVEPHGGGNPVEFNRVAAAEEQE